MSQQSGKTYGNSDHEELFSPDDPELDARIKSFRKTELELDEIMHDPYLEEARKEVAAMMVSYDDMKKKDSFRESENFIRKSFSGDKIEEHSDTVKEIKQEISKSDISDLSAEWVREWHRKKQAQVSSPADQERKNFIATSLSSENKEEVSFMEENNPAATILPLKQEDTGSRAERRRIFRYVSLAAASVLGAFIIFRTLLPSADAGTLYDNYYKTFEAITPTVRGGNVSVSHDYLSAINSFRKGDYNDAEAGFMKSVNENPSDGSLEFYLGLSSIETGNIDQAIASLSSAAAITGKFAKESRWYLGLAYLKKGDVSKATDCFSSLAASEGYYREPAEKILRRLKK